MKKAYSSKVLIGGGAVRTGLRIGAVGLSVLSLAVTPVALAQSRPPAAIVEEISGSVGNVLVLDYLSPGQKITLGPGSTIVLGYLRSCIREMVQGGSLTVGDLQSEIGDGANVVRAKTDCAGAKLQLTVEQAGKSGVVVFRGPPDASGVRQIPEPDFILHGLSPLIDTGGARKLSLERIDRAGEKFEIDLAATGVPRGRFYDFATANQSLTPGGTYRLAADSLEVIIRIHPFAAKGASPVAGRLIRF
jgi:hypothetical protein